MFHRAISRTALFWALWVVLSAEEDSCPAPLAIFTCSPEKGCSSDREWTQSCSQIRGSRGHYAIGYKPFDDDDSSLRVECSSGFSLQVGMLSNVTSRNVVHLQFVQCPFPNFPIIQLFNGSSLSGIELRKVLFESAVAVPGTQLQSVIFEGLGDHLLELSLTGNKIETLQGNIFQNLPNLETLSVEDNSLHTLPESLFINQSKLKFLNLKNNRLNSISKTIFSSLPNLTKLYLGHNRLQYFHPSVFQSLISLTVLDLEDNNFVEIPSSAFSRLSQLKNLSLANNNLSTLLADTLHSVNELENLDISNNSFAGSLPVALFSQLTSLKVISLENCNLTRIPSSFFNNCTNLSKVVLKNNRLQGVPENIFKYNKHLKYVDLSRNKISSLPSKVFPDEGFLEEVNFSTNNLTTLPISLFNRRSLQVKSLLLSSNYLSSIDKGIFRKLNKLQSLDLSNNLLTYRFDIELAPDIEVLDLSHNRIGSLPINFWLKYKKFKKFDIQYNGLSKVDVPILEPAGSTYPSLYFGHNGIVLVSVGQVSMYESKMNYDLNDSRPRSQIAIYLYPNPIYCDCQLAEFANYITTNRKRYANFPDGDKLTCNTPDYLEGKTVTSVPKTQFYCPSVTECTPPCTCRSRIDAIELVNCSSRNLDKLPEKFSYFQASILNFTSNELTSLEDLNKQQRWSEVEYFYLDNNKISSLESLQTIPRKAKVLSLRSNWLTHFPARLLKAIDSMPDLTLALGDNPWNCNCSVLPLKLWLAKNNRKVEDFKNVLCNTHMMPNGTYGRPMVATLRQDIICPLDTWPFRVQIIAVSTVAAIIAAVILVLSVIYYRNRQAVVAYVYIHFNQLFTFCYREKDLDEDKLFDAFVCYSSSDRDVTMSLISELENKEPSFKLCIHERDWLPGNYITVNISNSVQNSKRTILVISKEFLGSTWFPIEFQTAYFQMLQDRMDRIIVIVKGELPSHESLDKDLQLILSTKTYLVWGEKWFYEKLRYAMPHGSNVIHNGMTMT